MKVWSIKNACNYVKFFKSRFYKTHLGKSHIALQQFVESLFCATHVVKPRSEAETINAER